MNYAVFDAHCDTVSEIFLQKNNFDKNNLHIDFERMKKYPRYVQIFAAFIDKKAVSLSPKAYIKGLIDVYNKEIKPKTADSRYTSILAIEGGEAIEGSLENLEEFYTDGVRAMTLTWNYRNEICDGITEAEGRGLTSFGKTVVKKMNTLGMVIDVSHLSDKGFYDVAELSDKPFIASHSNCRSLCSHKRNLTDEQIKEIIRLNGVIGMNFYPVFLDNSGKCSAERIVDHMEHILDLGGENNLGLGSDFDGIEYLPDDMTGIESMESLISLMKDRGFGENIIEKILFGNFMRVFKVNFDCSSCNLQENVVLYKE